MKSDPRCPTSPSFNHEKSASVDTIDIRRDTLDVVLAQRRGAWVEVDRVGVVDDGDFGASRWSGRDSGVLVDLFG